MAKKSRSDDPPNPSSVANRDMLQRLNFLYQASAFLQTAAPSSSDLASGSSRKSMDQSGIPLAGKLKRAEVKKRKRVLSASDLSRSYVHDMRQVAQKATIRIDPSVKRTVCRGCDTILIPGVSSRVRIATSGSHGEVLVTHCLSCTTARRIPAPPASSGDRSLDAEMDIEVSDATRNGQRKRGRVQPRLPPLFEREGHVVFRGGEKLPSSSIS